MPHPRCLAVLLFHNDADLIADQIHYYKEVNHHDIIVFNHNSTDQSYQTIYNNLHKIEYVINFSKDVEFSSNEVHKTIYQILMNTLRPGRNTKISVMKGEIPDFADLYDWISFPESDEFLEGPDRSLTYYDHLCNVDKNKKIKKIRFDNYVFWFTSKDDENIKSPVERIRYYCRKSKCAPRLYAWRSACTRIRLFGHISEDDAEYEVIRWKTRHYEMRNFAQMKSKLLDRFKSYTKGAPGTNAHYKVLFNKFIADPNFAVIDPDQLHYDDGVHELQDEERFNWDAIY